MLTCPRSSLSFHSNAHHHGSLPQQLGVVWDLLLKADPEGPSLISHAAVRHRFHFALIRYMCLCSTLGSKNWVVSQFDCGKASKAARSRIVARISASSISRAISVISISLSVRPAAIAGVTRCALCVLIQLYQTVYSATMCSW